MRKKRGKKGSPAPFNQSDGMPLLVSASVQAVSGNPAASVWLMRCPGAGGNHSGMEWGVGVPLYG